MVYLKKQINKLEQRILSLQSAKLLKCHLCRNYKMKLDAVKEKVFYLLNERKEKYQEIASIR